MNIDKLLQKYAQEYVNGECRSNEYESRIKREKRMHMKQDLADGIFNELPFNFSKSQKVDVKFLIRLFPNFKKLHSKAKNEEIILAFIFYVNGLYNQRNNDFTKPEIRELIRKVIKDDDKEKELEKQLAFPQTYEIIHWKIVLYFMQKQPILPTEPRNIDHNILYKG